MKYGKVYLVGAGPGDPGLITVKGVECIKKAHVLIYDYLASPSLLNHAPAECDIIYVGKKGGDHTLPQDKINDLIIDKAREGKIVTRLKGGDPFIFGRGAEEAEELVDAGIEFEIVPGVTSAIAAPAYAGIPLTHRKFTATATLVTGHEDPTKNESNINWESLARGMGTIVFLMGVKNLPRIAAKLMEHGMAKNTPVALVQWGTTPEQKTVAGTLETIVERVEKAGLQSPAIIVVGNVVSLRDRLNWFEKKSLWGKRIVVTRAREQASNMTAALSDLGADVLEFPTIRVVPPKDWSSLDQALENINTYQWLIFTSVNGVKFFFGRLFENHRDVRCLSHIKTACIGPETARALRGFGLNSDIIPKSYVAEAVVEAFRNEPLEGRGVLIPRAETARPILPVELRKMGARVDEIPVYRTEPVSENRDTLIGHLEDKTIHLVTFTSSSTVTNFKSLLPGDRMDELMKGVAVACIGPVTAETAQSIGFKVDIVAENFTIPGLCEAVVKHLTSG